MIKNSLLSSTHQEKLTEIFKRLVQEQISIKDLRTILESLSEWAQTEKDTVLLTEYIRSSLKRYVSYKYSQGQSILSGTSKYCLL